MIGALRLALAMTVAAFHAGFMPGGLAIGVTAVTCFYVISGYAMTGLMAANFGGAARGQVPAFYRDRLFRLLPQYGFWMVLGLAGMALGWRHGALQAGPVTPLSLFANLTILPLNFYMYLPQVGASMVIPQAWSIGAELVFYAAFPWLLRSRVACWAALAAAAAAFLLATNGVLNPDWWAYRLMPAPLLFFLLGHALHARNRAMAGAILGFFALAGLQLLLAQRLFIAFNFELVIGGLAAAPLLLLCGRAGTSVLDQRLGAASYGCYLCHWMLMPWLAGYPGQAWTMVAVALLSALAGWVSYRLVEAPTVRLRRRLRLAAAPAQAAPRLASAPS